MEAHIGDLDYLPPAEKAQEWESWQDWLRQRFPGWMVGFTLTTEVPLTARFVQRAAKASLAQLGYPGFFVVEGTEEGKRPHVHGFVTVPWEDPDGAGVLAMWLSGYYSQNWKGFSRVEVIRDRVLWCRYITKELCLGAPFEVSDAVATERKGSLENDQEGALGDSGGPVGESL